MTWSGNPILLCLVWELKCLGYYGWGTCFPDSDGWGINIRKKNVVSLVQPLSLFFSRSIFIYGQSWVKTLIKLRVNIFFAERGYSLPNKYFDSIKGRLSDSYSVIGQV